MPKVRRRTGYAWTGKEGDAPTKLVILHPARGMVSLEIFDNTKDGKPARTCKNKHFPSLNECLLYVRDEFSHGRRISWDPPLNRSKPSEE